MNKKSFWKASAKILLISALLTNGFAPLFVKAQSAPQVSANADASNIAALETKFEQRRAALNVVGASLAVVKDGKVIFSKGFGYRDLEKKTPVTTNTLFAIGSSSKAFTALTVLMNAERGKLSLEDSPKKFLPYFKINDPETDTKITVRDLLRHSSGVSRTDLAWMSGVLNREETIRVLADAKPTAKLGETFQYQNLMFVAAGEIVAKTSGKAWEKVVEDEIFKQLGMTNSNLSVPQTLQSKDFAKGYEYRSDTKQTRFLPMRTLSAIAPAGAINSSADDMAKWLLFLTNKGELNGKRLISAQSFDEWTKPQMKIGGKTAYALGWFTGEKNGSKVIQHGGNIDGFSAQVAFYPEHNLGFVVLTNADSTPLAAEMLNIVPEIFFPKTETAASNADVSRFLGRYKFAEAGVDVEVKMIDGAPHLSVPQQPDYKLIPAAEPQKYRLANAPDGFFVTFKPSAGDVTELYLEQPHGNFILQKIAEKKVEDIGAQVVLKELVGIYHAADKPSVKVEIKEEGADTTFNISGQQPYKLKARAKDEYALSPLPDSYFMRPVRDAAGKISAVKIIQPTGEFLFTRTTDKEEKFDLSVDELMKKVIEALGGESNMRKINTRVTKSEAVLINQGLRQEITAYQTTPNKAFNSIGLYAVGKKIGEMQEVFDGANGYTATDFSEPNTQSGKGLVYMRIKSDLAGLLNWKTNYSNAKIIKADKLDSEDVYVVQLNPENASASTLYVSQKTFLPVRQDSFEQISPQIELPVITYFEDYRAVDSVLLPFRQRTENYLGKTLTTILDVKNNVKINGDIFRITVKRR